MPAAKNGENQGIEPEQVLLCRLLLAFGPAPFELIVHIDGEYWSELLTALSEVVAEKDPSKRFGQWKETDFPNLNLEAKRMIHRGHLSCRHTIGTKGISRNGARA